MLHLSPKSTKIVNTRQKGGKNVLNSFQFIAKYIKRHRFQYMAGIITLFVVDFANLFIPKLTGTITDGLTAHTFAWDDVKFCLLQIFMLGLTLAIGRFLWRFLSLGPPVPSKKNFVTICSATWKR